MSRDNNDEAHSRQGPTIWRRRDGTRTGSFAVDGVIYLIRQHDRATLETLRQQTLAGLEAALENLAETRSMVSAGADRVESTARLDASINQILDLIEAVS
jgi:hypothetical protein